MPKIEKVRVNVKERVEDNFCDLSLSELSEVPVRDIANFKRVTTLDLSSNRLITLGKNFVTLTRLTKLDLSKNQIKYLPDDFGLLRNLRHLDLYDNKLEYLPISFGDLTNLRYLDLKGNPLAPGLAKIVGHCLTTKDCQDSARNTVKFAALMKLEAEKDKEKLQLEATAQVATDNVEDNKTVDEMQKNNKKKNKKKSKNKKPTNQNHKITPNPPPSPANAVQPTIVDNNNKQAKPNKKHNNNKANKTRSNSSTALTSIFIFFLLLAINVFIIYMITFKNPEIADKLVELMPPQYRDWILTKTEFFRLRVSDWIHEFRTPPEEN